MRRLKVNNSEMMSEVDRLISEGQYVTLRTKGSSMLPFIRGDRDNVILVKDDNFKMYDIALAEVEKNKFVIHRIVSIYQDQVTLMGDGNSDSCEICTTDKVIAIAAKVVDDNGRGFNCRSHWHRFKVRVWWSLLPLRRYLLAIYKLIHRL